MPDLLTETWKDRLVKTWEHAGLKCVLMVNPATGGINGYVQLPPPLDEITDYDDKAFDPIRVHGGLTFLEGGYVGFDTAHAGDVWDDVETRHPGAAALGGILSSLLEGDPDAIHWTQEMVEEETERLADQLAALAEAEEIFKALPQET